MELSKEGAIGLAIVVGTLYWTHDNPEKVPPPDPTWGGAYPEATVEAEEPDAPPSDGDGNVWTEVVVTGESEYIVQPDDVSTWQISQDCSTNPAAQAVIFEAIKDPSIKPGDKLTVPQGPGIIC